MPGQFRGWFNSLFWASVTITDKAPFKALFGYETLKDEKGKEMHKSKGNAIWFDDAVEKIGVDPIRLLYCLQDPSQELRFGYTVLKEPKNNMNILYNMSKLVENSEKVTVNRIEDKWILSRYNNLIKKVTKELEELHPHLATRALKEFWLNDLSRGYIQFVRDRLAANDNSARFVLKEIYIGLLKMLAPVVPFITEKTWQELRNRKMVSEESVHLCDWPKNNNKLINEKLEAMFDSAFEVIEKGLSERDKAQIGLKWPLAKAVVTVTVNLDPANHLKELIAGQLNVKEIDLKLGKDLSVKLDTKLTKELESEGYGREISRKVQAARKKAGFVKTDNINLAVIVEEDLRKLIASQLDLIKERTNSKEVIIKNIDDKSYKNRFEDKVKGQKLLILFNKT